VAVAQPVGSWQRDGVRLGVLLQAEGPRTTPGEGADCSLLDGGRERQIVLDGDSEILITGRSIGWNAC
jgi:hypothetical protein